MSQTRIFVSSTCYDLSHLRQALQHNIAALGHVPVMSELASFRVDPHQGTISNCRANVINNTDIFLLIIGGRRGSVDDQLGKSIVNLEYQAAIEANLDIIVFVDNAVLNLLPMWRRNPEQDFAPIVDSGEVLKFVSVIQSEQRWTYPFSKESEIFDVLKQQFSGQLRQLLEQRRSGQLNIYRSFYGESKEALELIRFQKPLWEYLLTAELLRPRVNRVKEAFSDIKLGRVLGPHRLLKGTEYLNWLKAKFWELEAAVKTAEYRISEPFAKAWGAVGQSGSPTEILSAVESLIAVMDAMINLESEIYRTHGPEASKPVREVMLGMSEEVLDALSSIEPKIMEAMSVARNHNADKGPLILTIDVKFTFNRAEQFSPALEKMNASMRSQDWG